MIVRKVCLFFQNNSISAAAGLRSCRPMTACGSKRQSTSIAADALKGTQRG